MLHVYCLKHTLNINLYYDVSHMENTDMYKTNKDKKQWSEV